MSPLRGPRADGHVDAVELLVGVAVAVGVGDVVAGHAEERRVVQVVQRAHLIAAAVRAGANPAVR